MAKFNEVLLYGQVFMAPTIIWNESHTDMLTVICPLLVMRGWRDYITREIKHIGFDKPILMTSSPYYMQEIAQWKIGDMIQVKGNLTTKDVNKSTVCPICGAVNIQPGVVTFVNPIYTKVTERSEDLLPEERRRGLSDTEIKDALRDVGTDLMRDSCEISNQAKVVGILCNDPVCYEAQDRGLTITNYQLAVPRKIKILEDAEENHIDFPWVKAYGATAREDYKYLRKDSFILVDGILQTRKIKRKRECEACHASYEFSETVIDLVPTSTEYLRRFKTEQDLAEDEAKARREAVERIRSEGDILRSAATPDTPMTMQQILSKQNLVDTYNGE